MTGKIIWIETHIGADIFKRGEQYMFLNMFREQVYRDTLEAARAAIEYEVGVETDYHKASNERDQYGY